MPSQLAGEDKVMFQLLLEKHGVFNLLRELEKYGYRPDEWTSVPLDEAIRKLFNE